MSGLEKPIFDLEGCYWAYSEQKGTLRMNERTSTVKAFTANTDRKRIRYALKLTASGIERNYKIKWPPD
jgi:hypothetical protein